MTTIAWTDGLIASDSQATRGGEAEPAGQRKLLIPAEGEYWEVMGAKIIVMGYAGNLHGCHFLKEAVSSPGGLTHRTQLNLPSAMNVSSLIIDELGRGWHIICTAEELNNGTVREELAVEPVLPPFATGSGRVWANAVMSLDKDAREAVRVAITRDIYSGGQIQYMELPDPVKVPSRRPNLEHVNDLPTEKDPYGPVVPHPNAPPLQDLPINDGQEIPPAFVS